MHKNFKSTKIACVFGILMILIACYIEFSENGTIFGFGLNHVDEKNHENEVNVKVGPKNDESEPVYDRNEWTSSYQWYKCNEPNHDHNSNDYNGDDDGEYRSIRAYSYYESVWYDWETERYLDPYTNEWIENVKETDYDHIIPLAYANAHGAAQWGEEKKKAYADDPSVGVCCNSSDNRAKGAKGPSEWLPEENVEMYCYTWLVIAEEYNLTLSEKDLATINEVLFGVDVSELHVINEYVQ